MSGAAEQHAERIARRAALEAARERASALGLDGSVPQSPRTRLESFKAEQAAHGGSSGDAPMQSPRMRLRHAVQKLSLKRL